MKKATLIIVSAIMALCVVWPSSAQAQFRIGPKAGVTVNSLHFNNEVFDNSNRAGFTGGLMTEFTVPVVGIGFDLSFMYVRRNASWMEQNNVLRDNRDYFEIPLNLKWKLGLPIVNRIITPYLTTGPSISFLTSRKAFHEMYRNKKYDSAWNFGFGAELFHHVQIGATYGIGISKAVKALGGGSGVNIKGKNRYWTITAAYLF